MLETRQRRCVLENCCVLHTSTGSLSHTHTHKHTRPGRTDCCLMLKNIHCLSRNAVAGKVGSTVSRSAGPSWRRARRGQGGVQARWALFRSQWRPCWEYWTRCSMLLCSVTGPMSRSRSLKNSGETERVVSGIHAQHPAPSHDVSPSAESAPASRESLDW